MIRRIDRILEELGEHPYFDVGKPEPLKHDPAAL
ncbi:MAG: type II toxin-antitoxin system YoeB family toxin [Dyadobacter sp.]|nr:type II toxin-antitoxin system YoeB family toxin [Dyadobacter sp.]